MIPNDFKGEGGDATRETFPQAQPTYRDSSSPEFAYCQCFEQKGLISTISSGSLLRETTPCSQRGSIIPDSPDTYYASDAQAPKKADAFGNSQVGVERMAEEDSTSGECGTAEIIGGEERRRVLRV